MEPVGAIALKCPGCGARLEIAPGLVHFACGSCGCVLSVVRRGGTVALAPEQDPGTAGDPRDRAAAERSLWRLEEELAAQQRELEDKAKTLQYLRQHLNDQPGGFELKTALGVWPVLWKSAAGTALLLLAVLADQREGLPLRGLALSIVIPFGLGFGYRSLRNRWVAGRNARTEQARQEAVRSGQEQVQRRIQAAQREHDEAARKIAALNQAIARGKAGSGA